MRRLLIALTLVFVAIPLHSLDRLSVHDLVFLTRDGCANTARMRSELDAALRSLGVQTKYAVIDLEKLDPSDIRRGYGTPTVLYKGRDLFGMAVPTQAAPPS